MLASMEIGTYRVALLVDDEGEFLRMRTPDISQGNVELMTVDEAQLLRKFLNDNLPKEP